MCHTDGMHTETHVNGFAQITIKGLIFYFFRLLLVISVAELTWLAAHNNIEVRTKEG